MALFYLNWNSNNLDPSRFIQKGLPRRSNHCFGSPFLCPAFCYAGLLSYPAAAGCRIGSHPSTVLLHLTVRFQKVMVTHFSLTIRHRIIPRDIDVVPVIADLYQIPYMAAGINETFNNSDMESSFPQHSGKQAANNLGRRFFQNRSHRMRCIACSDRSYATCRTIQSWIALILSGPDIPGLRIVGILYEPARLPAETALQFPDIGLSP